MNDVRIVSNFPVIIVREREAILYYSKSIFVNFLKSWFLTNEVNHQMRIYQFQLIIAALSEIIATSHTNSKYSTRYGLLNLWFHQGLNLIINCTRIWFRDSFNRTLDPYCRNFPGPGLQFYRSFTRGLVPGPVLYSV